MNEPEPNFGVLVRWPRTSPFRTSGSCSEGAHVGKHRFVKSDRFDKTQREYVCTECGETQSGTIWHLPYRYAEMGPCAGLVSVGDKGDHAPCECWCHPEMARHGHWHMVNAGPKIAVGGLRTYCLGYRTQQTEQQTLFQMPSKAYLKRMDDEDDVCWARRATRGFHLREQRAQATVSPEQLREAAARATAHPLKRSNDPITPVRTALESVKIMTPEEYDAVVEAIDRGLTDLMLRAPYKASQLMARDAQRIVRKLIRGELHEGEGRKS